MSAAIVALVLQIVWHVTRAALELSGVAAQNGNVAALSFGITIATDLVIAAAAADCARRLDGARKTGAWLAAVAYLAVAVTSIVYEGVLYRSGGGPGVRWWIDTMRSYGWGALDAVAVIGFAVAAGRRTAWFAPIGVGAALLGGRPTAFLGSVAQVEVIASIAVEIAFLVWMALEAERHATPPTVSRESAVRGLRRAELIAWVWAALTIIDIVGLLRSLSIYVALPIAVALIAINLALAFVAWSIARACVEKMPRWLWYLSATCSAWAAARLIRSWVLTLTKWWDRLDQVPLHHAHWSMGIPTAIAAISALLALAVFASRTGSRQLSLLAIAAATASMLAFCFRIALPEELVVVNACYFVLNLATARINRRARTALDNEFPRARLL